MKAEYLKPSAEFKPIVIHLTLETKRELDFMASLFNFTAVCDLVRSAGSDPEPLREALRAAGGSTDLAGAISEELRTTYWFKENGVR